MDKKHRCNNHATIMQQSCNNHATIMQQRALMQHILLDTNFLLIPCHYHIDIFTEIRRLFSENLQFYVISGSLEELENIAKKGRQKEKMQVKMAKSIMKAQNIKMITVDQEGSVDDLLVACSKKGFLVATQDKFLKRRIRSLHKEILTLRQGKYVIRW